MITRTTKRPRRAARGATRTFTRSWRYLACGLAGALLAAGAVLPDRVLALEGSGVVVSEVHPGGSGNGSYGADWFEVTNTGTVDVDITGWRVDDSSNAFATAVALRGVTVIPAGRSAVFLEGTASGSTDATLIASFSTAWFGSATPPAGTLIGAYGGSGIGLSGSGDAVALFDAAGVPVTAVSFGAASSGLPLATFDNSAGLGGVVPPLPTLSTYSVAGVNQAFVAFNGAEIGSPGIRITAAPLTGIDLATYVRVGRFDLPEPTRTTAPPNSVLAQEASAVTWNRDTDTLFVVGDRGTSIVQVSKTGQLIDSMTLAPGASPQGTDFYDPEGLTYVGNGRFVLVEERDRQAVLFTYVAGATLTRAATQTVKLGTFADNTGNEGISWDAQTAGFIAVKEIAPQGIFQTGIDFAAGTATNGSPTTVNSVDLFDPALANLLDFADVYALSNLPSLSGPDSQHLLVLSQEEGRIVHVDRQGQVSSSLAIVADSGSPLSVADQQHEGLTMDGNGVLYVVNENGGGDTNHPQLWVYAPSLVPNQPPSAIVLGNVVTTMAENTSTVTRLKVADIAVADDGLGANVVQVTGADAGAFEADNSGLYIKAGTVLDFESKSSYSVSVEVDDASVGATPDAAASYTLTLTDVEPEAPPVAVALFITEVAPWASGNAPYGADWFEVTNKGASPVNLTGWRMDDDSGAFGSGVTLSGVSTIAPGESVIFLETGDLATTRAAFLTAWFGATPPAGLQVGNYTGGGVGLSTGGDSVHLFDAAGNRVTGISFGTSVAGFSFDNAAGLGATTPPLPVVSTTSVAGVNGAFLAVDGVETGSPGTITTPVVLPAVVITEITPWASGNAPYAADWFEVTNIGASSVNVTGWKMDDDSGSFASGAALTGVTSIAPGESVIFMETSDLATAKAAFLTAWFGANPPAALQVGAYSGSGVGLGAGGDAVSLFDAGGRRITGVSVGASVSGFTFDNAAGAGSAAAPLPVIATLSAAGVNGAFLAVDGVETGSPGSIRDVTPPVIDPVAPLVVEATGPTGATVSYTPPATFDVADGPGVASCLPAPGAVFALGVTTVSCTAQDVAGNTASITFAVTVEDTTAPVLTVPAGVSATTTVASGAVVSFTTSATDAVSGSTPVVCAPASGSTFAVGATTVQCTSADAAGNSGAARFVVTVTLTAPPATPDGRIYGLGYLDASAKHHHFAFRVSEVGQRDYGRFEYWVSERRACDRDDDDYDRDRRDGHQDREYGRDHRKATSRFEATSIASVVFADEFQGRARRGFRPGEPPVDSVTLTGAGTWNGKSGYRFTLTASDRGEPGRGRDTFNLVIEDSRGRVVASVDDTLDAGNIQSTRLGWLRLLDWF